MYRNTIITNMVGNLCDSLTRSRDSGDSFTNTSTVTARLNFDSSITTPEGKSGASESNQKNKYNSLFQEQFRERRHSLEILSAQNAIRKLEKKVELLETSKKRSRIEFERDMGLCHSEEKVKQNKLENLEQTVAQLVEKINQYQEMSANARKSEDNVKYNLEKKLLDLQREHFESDERFQEEITILKRRISDLQASNTKFEHELEMKSMEMKSLNEQLRIQKKTGQDYLHHINELEDKADKLNTAEIQIKELNEKISKYEETTSLSSHLQSHLSTISELEKENRKLKAENKLLIDKSTNVSLLEEQINSLTKVLERSEQRCRDIIRLESENENLTKQLKQWELLGIADSQSSPQDLARQIGELQNREANLTLKCGEMTTKINVLTNEKKSLEVNLATAQQNIREKDKKIQQNSELIKRLQKKLLLLTKERDSYHRGLEFHEKEINANSPSTLNSRIQSLENLVKGYQTHIEKLEEDLQNANKAHTENVDVESQHSKKLEQLQEKLRQIEKQNETLQNQVINLNQINDKLREEKEELQFRVEQREMKGDYDPSTTRVIRMKCNPLSTAQLQRKNEIEALQKENLALQERVKILQEGKEGQTDLTARVEVNLLNQPTNLEIEVLKEQLKNAELKNQRLMEAFSEKSQELREVCYILTGFRIDMTNVHQYKVISTYAQSPDDFLVFKMGSKGEMQLLENSYSSQWGGLIDLYLQRQHSIPAFLSNLTLELFSQQTVNTSVL